MRAKRKEQSEIKKMFKDSLAHDAHYQELLAQIKKLREEKKSIENAAWAQSRGDAEKLDLLSLDIKSDKQVISDIALNMYVAGQTVEVVDENQTRWVPNFSVTFIKDAEGVEEKSKTPQAAAAF
jgi:polynucleotide 5'-kinase involved in rRNA processing